MYAFWMMLILCPVVQVQVEVEVEVKVQYRKFVGVSRIACPTNQCSFAPCMWVESDWFAPFGGYFAAVQEYSTCVGCCRFVTWLQYRLVQQHGPH